MSLCDVQSPLQPRETTAARPPRPAAEHTTSTSNEAAKERGPGRGDRCPVGLSPRPPTIDPVTVTLDLPAEAQARLQAEATRRGITLDQLIAELADQLPAETAAEPGTLEGFFGSGDSGDPSWASRDLHELRHDLAQRRLSEPA